jgi:acyl-CoA thioesterase FadM
LDRSGKTENFGGYVRIKRKNLKPLNITKGEVTVRGKVISVQNRMAKMALSLYDGQKQKCAAAEVVHFFFPENRAKSKYHYPGHEVFYER